MKKLLGRIEGVSIWQDDDLRVHYAAKAAIDADGSNSQSGGKAAYMTADRGLDWLANGGMKWDGSKVVIKNAWAKNIVILGADGQPRAFPGGVIASKTAWRNPKKKENDPTAYVESSVVPYAVIPPLIRKKCKGVVLGCLVKMTNARNGKTVMGVVADIGPGAKIGELSIAAADALGIPSSPKSGGTASRIVLYEMWPGTAAPGYVLIPA